MHNFVGHPEWKQYPIDDIVAELLTEDIKVLVLRPILFFHAEEYTTMARIKANFTDEAISKLIHDKFIKII
jgi:hypothetical protein